MANFIGKIFKSKIFISLVSVAVIAVVLIFITSFYLRAYTHHGQKLFTPSFKGLSLDEAYKLAKEKDIKIEIIDSVYNAYGEAGTVIEQTPKANFMIKKGRTIFIVIKAKGEKIVKMPDLGAQSLIQARSLLETAGLLVGEITFQPSPGNPHLVLDQLYNGEHINFGTQLPAGSKIDLVVGEETGAYAVVPDFSGLTVNSATYKAAENYLNIGSVHYDNSVISARDSVEAVVWKQSVNPGIKTDYGQEVSLWLTTDPDNQ